MMEDKPIRICLGAISGAQGIQGEVIIRSFTQDPENIGAYGQLTDVTGKVSYDLKVLRIAKKGVIARIKGITTRNMAEALKGTELYVLSDLLPEPDPGEFYYRDLIGLKALNEAGELVGEILSVQNFGAGDLLEIKLAGSEKSEFLPFHDDYLVEVSIENQRVIVKSTAGLWE